MVMSFEKHSTTGSTATCPCFIALCHTPLYMYKFPKSFVVLPGTVVLHSTPVQKVLYTGVHVPNKHGYSIGW